MLAIVPVTVKSAPLLVPLALLFEKLGPQNRHRLLVSCDTAVLEDAQKFAEAVKRLFADVSVFPAGTIAPSQAGRTAHLRETLAHLVHKNTDPWIWMEHACPTNPAWLDQIQQEWDLKPADRRVLGCVEPTYYRATPAQQARVGTEKPLFHHKGHHVRFGVYPHDFAERVTLLRSATTLPWELHCQNEVVPMTHPSFNLATLWASRNFRTISNGRAEGEQTPGVESEIRANGRKHVDLDSVAVVHGCRDGSLEFLVSKRKFKPRSMEAKMAMARENVAEAQETVGEYADKIRAQEAELQTLRVRVADLERQLADLGVSPEEDDEIPDEASRGDEEAVDLPSEAEEFEGELSALPESEEDATGKKRVFAPGNASE